MTVLAVESAVVVITAATGAVGRAVAEDFAVRGARLILAGRDQHALKELAARCRTLGAEVEAVEADLGDTASVRRLVNAARAGGRIDIWISQDETGNAGDLQAVLPVFLKQKRGTFIAVGATVFPAALRAQLSARRAIHLCEILAGRSDEDAGKIARAVADMARNPRPRVSIGANDGYIERLIRAGSAFSMTALAGLGGIVAALGQAKLG